VLLGFLLFLGSVLITKDEKVIWLRKKVEVYTEGKI
jgi:hypothetical protein